MSANVETLTSRNSGSALFHQLYLLLREAILRGQYAPESQLPGEKVLAEIHGVSRITVRKALDLLAGEDLVRRVHGSGTFVAARAHPATLRGQIDSFAQQADWLTRNTTVELIDVVMQAADAETCRTMGLSDGDTVQRSLRLRSYLGKPCLLLDTFVPKWVAETYDRHELETASLNTALKRAGIHIASADYTVTASSADARRAELLQVPVAAALLHMIWVIRDEQMRVVEYQIVHARPDTYVLHTVLRAN